MAVFNRIPAASSKPVFLRVAPAFSAKKNNPQKVTVFVQPGHYFWFHELDNQGWMWRSADARILADINCIDASMTVSLNTMRRQTSIIRTFFNMKIMGRNWQSFG